MTYKPSRTCPTCRIRWQVGLDFNPNFVTLPFDKASWYQLRRAAEAFDRKASNLDEEEGSSGAGDGQLYTAADFVEWLRSDTSGFKVQHEYEADGINRHRGQIEFLPYFHRKGVA